MPRERLPLARAAWLAACGLALLTSGCVVYHRHPAPGPVVVQAPPQHEHHGPPPHAPAHGYRRHHAKDDVDLVFDADLGVYVVLGHAGIYWDRDQYFVWRDGSWRVSARIDGVWVSVGNDKVPSRLVAKYAHEDEHKKGHGRGKSHARPHGHARGYPANQED